MKESEKPWQGLASVLRDGLDGYPAAQPPDPPRPARPSRKTSRREKQLEWGEVT